MLPEFVKAREALMREQLKMGVGVYPYLPRADVATTSAAAYMYLLSGNAA